MLISQKVSQMAMGIFSNSFYLDSRSSNIDEIVGHLLSFIQKDAGCDSEQELVDARLPDRESTNAIIRASIDILKDYEIPFEDPSAFQAQHSPTPRFERRQLLVIVLRNYLHAFGGFMHSKGTILKDLLDLPVYVNFRGLPINLLARYMLSISITWGKGRFVQLSSMFSTIHIHDTC